jgi:hypothetical protein
VATECLTKETVTGTSKLNFLSIRVNVRLVTRLCRLMVTFSCLHPDARLTKGKHNHRVLLKCCLVPEWFVLLPHAGTRRRAWCFLPYKRQNITINVLPLQQGHVPKIHPVNRKRKRTLLACALVGKLVYIPTTVLVARIKACLWPLATNNLSFQ